VTETTSARSVSSTPATVIDLIPDAKEVRVTVSYLVRQHKKSNKRQSSLLIPICSLTDVTLILSTVSRNLLDSKMVSMWGDGWVELNVSKAVREWRNASANLGLFVEVEDLESKKLPPALFFREMNCSVDTGMYPINEPIDFLKL
jgi:TGF-beta propeptide